jgi:pimeloyl-ACP methyl ester carboxylesterase
VAALIAHKELERPAVAGLSMGGYTALALAAGFPGLARAYAFVSTSAAPDDEAGRLRRADGLAVLRRKGWKAFATGLLPVLLSESLPGFEKRAEALLGMFARAGDAGLSAALFSLANRSDRRPILPALGAPSVAIVGDADRLTPPDSAREIASAAPGCRLVVLPGIAHMSAMEAPEAVAAALAGL